MKRTLAILLLVTFVAAGVMGESVFLPSYSQAKEETTNRRLLALGGFLVGATGLAIMAAGDPGVPPVLMTSVGMSVGGVALLASDESRSKMERFERAMELEPVLTGREKEAILDSFVFVGMSEPSLRLAWGDPTRINRSSYGPDQYVYPGYRYVYVNDQGIVEAWN